LCINVTCGRHNDIKESFTNAPHTPRAVSTVSWCVQKNTVGERGLSFDIMLNKREYRVTHNV